jgi:hypothetical protein
MLVALEILLFRGRLLNRRFYGVCGALLAMALIAAWLKWRGSSLDFFLFDLHHATSEDHNTSRITYLLTQTRVVATYLRLLCLPLGQNLMHDSPVYTSLFALPVLGSLALHLSLMATAAFLCRFSGRNMVAGVWRRGVLQRLAAVGIVWFYLALAVESSIFPIRDIIFEHRVYLPSAGFLLALTASAALLLKGRRGMTIAWALLVTVCLLLGSLTIARNRLWHEPLLFWQDAAAKSPNKYLALATLGGEYMKGKRPEKALPLFVRAMELHPSLYLKTEVAIGQALQAMNIYGGRFTTGEEYVLPGGPAGNGTLDHKAEPVFDAVIYNNMGLAYEYLREPVKALESYKVAVIANPGYTLAWYNLALLAVSTGDTRLVNEAVAQLQALDPRRAKELASVILH